MMSFSMLFSTAMVFIIGLLLIDLVPLQETMMCDDYTNSTSCPEYYFSQSLEAAQAKFLAAAAAAKAKVTPYVVTEEGGRQYVMHAAFIAGKKPSSLLVHMSSPSGIEGYAASAIQTRLLKEWNATSASGPSVLFLHAVNPYGMSHMQIGDEHNVDFTHYHAATQDNSTCNAHEVRALLAPGEKAPRFIDRYMFLARAIAAAVRQRSLAAVLRAHRTGQQHDPRGVGYGGPAGKQPAALRRVREAIAAHKGEARTVMLLTVRTSGGKTGAESMKVASREAGPCGTEEFVAAAGTTVTERFGTVSPLFVSRAVLFENAAARYAGGSYVHTVMRTWLRDAFYPQEMSFKKAVLKKGEDTFWRIVTDGVQEELWRLEEEED